MAQTVFPFFLRNNWRPAANNAAATVRCIEKIQVTPNLYKTEKKIVTLRKNTQACLWLSYSIKIAADYLT